MFISAINQHLTSNPIQEQNKLTAQKREGSLFGFTSKLPEQPTADVFVKSRGGQWVGKAKDEKTGEEVVLVAKSNWDKQGVLDSTEVLSMKRSDMSVGVKTINDYEHNTHYQAIIENPLTADQKCKKMISERKDLITGKTVAKQIYEMSEVPGIYNVTEIDNLGRKKVLSSAIKTKDGAIYISKNMTSLDGTTTTFRYKKDASGNHISSFNQIIDKNGKVLSTVDRTYDRINENLAKSSVNGRHYTIEHNGKVTTVTDEFTQEKTVLNEDDYEMQGYYAQQMKLVRIISGYNPKESDEPVTGKLFRQLPGDSLISFKEDISYVVSLEDGLDSAFMRDYNILHTTDDAFIVSHELGHSKDALSAEELEDGESMSLNPLADNPEFKKEYTFEKAAFLKAFPSFKEEYIDYFINAPEDRPERGRKEIIAESNAINCYYPIPHEILAMRTQVLQQYFPRTLAIANKLMTPIAIDDGQNRNNAGDIIVAEKKIYVPKFIVA